MFTHADANTAAEAGASQVGSRISSVAQLPEGVPNEAKRTAAIRGGRPAPAGQPRGRVSCSGTIPHVTGWVAGGGGGGAGTTDLGAMCRTASGGSILACRFWHCDALGVVADAACQPESAPPPSTKPGSCHPTGSPRASMYSRNPVPAEWACRGGPGWRCTSPLKARHVASVATVITCPPAKRSTSCSMTLGGLCIACSASACLPAARKRVTSRVA
mmetsp:Transcript_9917/g.22918  ORF Transcript_9917/g.22918 Transcript_9917/m.22918 type:complete len:216 (+) Transcript_9917:2030-2677(+)